MGVRHYYLVSALPAIGELGSVPPWTTADLADHVSDSGGPGEVVAALLLGDDLLQRDALLAGEIHETNPAVLTQEQAAGEAPLPGFLAPEDGGDEVRHVADAVWVAWFQHAADVARRHGSRFLQAWVGHEVAMRNALAAARAKALGLDPVEQVLATALADTDEDFTSVLADWAAAPDPLAGQRVLDQARWSWLAEHEAWFSFGADELVVYAARLMLIDRWNRVGSADLDGHRR